MIERGEIIQFYNKGNFRDAVLEDLLKLYSEKGSVEIVKSSGKKKIDKIALANTSDVESKKIINAIIKGDVFKLNNGAVEKYGKKLVIKPLYLFLDKEVLIYAKLRKLKFKINKNKKENKINLFIDDLEKKHPEVKQSVISSYVKLFG